MQATNQSCLLRMMSAPSTQMKGGNEYEYLRTKHQFTKRAAVKGFMYLIILHQLEGLEAETFARYSNVVVMSGGRVSEY